MTGLEIDGAGAGFNGIVFNSGSSLSVSNCLVKDFVSSFTGNTGNGILIAPTTGTLNFNITDTSTLNNQQAGISFAPPSGSATATGSIDHVVANNNSIGIELSLLGNANGLTAVSISNSVASDNGGSGIDVGGSTIAATIDNDQLSNNEWGVFVSSGTALLSRSVITENSTNSVSNQGTIYTYQDNRIYLNGNSNAVSGNALAPITGQ